ncbi:hypothetical protein GGX14DRAFT_392444 [Mycena pura]|uniref:Uncharacterized protein n=1 Tax=Mycena pura TaxID=153505 RepID=A0AAD6VIY6_9AGAR|nr:hypothetical protein GGX14DRAFT_392444 [Mycena pura]
MTSDAYGVAARCNASSRESGVRGCLMELNNEAVDERGLGQCDHAAFRISDDGDTEAELHVSEVGDGPLRTELRLETCVRGAEHVVDMDHHEIHDVTDDPNYFVQFVRSHVTHPKIYENFPYRIFGQHYLKVLRLASVLHLVSGEFGIQESCLDIDLLKVPPARRSNVQDRSEGFEAGSWRCGLLVIASVLLPTTEGAVPHFVPNNLGTAAASSGRDISVGAGHFRGTAPWRRRRHRLGGTSVSGWDILEGQCLGGIVGAGHQCWGGTFWGDTAWRHRLGGTSVLGRDILEGQRLGGGGGIGDTAWRHRLGGTSVSGWDILEGQCLSGIVGAGHQCWGGTFWGDTAWRHRLGGTSVLGRDILEGQRLGGGGGIVWAGHQYWGGTF